MDTYGRALTMGTYNEHLQWALMDGLYLPSSSSSSSQYPRLITSLRYLYVYVTNHLPCLHPIALPLPPKSLCCIIQPLSQILTAVITLEPNRLDNPYQMLLLV